MERGRESAQEPQHAIKEDEGIRPSVYRRALPLHRDTRTRHHCFLSIRIPHAHLALVFVCLVRHLLLLLLLLLLLRRRRRASRPDSGLRAREEKDAIKAQN